MLNDFWFLKFDFAPHDPAVEARCRRRYQQPWRFHWIFYVFFGFVCWPIALFVGVIEFIRLNKAAYHNALVYNAEYRGRPADMPSQQEESRIWVWLLGLVIVGVITAITLLFGPG